MWGKKTICSPGSGLSTKCTFGMAVALAADGNLLAVGSPGEDSTAKVINGDQRQ